MKTVITIEIPFEPKDLIHKRHTANVRKLYRTIHQGADNIFNDKILKISAHNMEEQKIPINVCVTGSENKAIKDLPLSIRALNTMRDDLDMPVYEFVETYTRGDLLNRRTLGKKVLIDIVETIREETGLVMEYGDLDNHYGKSYLRSINN